MTLSRHSCPGNNELYLGNITIVRTILDRPVSFSRNLHILACIVIYVKQRRCVEQWDIQRVDDDEMCNKKTKETSKEILHIEEDL